MSQASLNTNNPIRKIVDTMKFPAEPVKPIIKLTLGDPTCFGNFRIPDAMTDAISKSTVDRLDDGYTHSAGLPAAREAIARLHDSPEAPLTADDVMIASGCSGALEIVMKAVLNPGDAVLVPAPGFALYEVIAHSYGFGVQHYNLLPDSGWQADLQELDALVTPRTRALLVNDPSNPCGSVYPEEHLTALLAFAERHRLVVIADEVYAGIVLPDSGARFSHLARLTTTVPVLAVGGLAKRFCVPGWRLGWILVHDRNGVLKNVRDGILRLCNLIIGANRLVQAALPAILQPAPGSAAAAELAAFHAHILQELQRNAAVVLDLLAAVPGLRVVRPQGAMYVMVGVDVAGFDAGVDSDVSFAELLMEEECVFVLPGQCFNMPNYFRVVLCPPADVIAEACARIRLFCERHYTAAAAEHVSVQVSAE